MYMRATLPLVIYYVSSYRSTVSSQHACNAVTTMKTTSFAALFAAIATSRFITGIRSESWQTELMEAGKGEDVKCGSLFRWEISASSKKAAMGTSF